MKRLSVSVLIMFLFCSVLSIPALADSGGNGSGNPRGGGQGSNGGPNGGGDQVSRPAFAGLQGLMQLELTEEQREQIRLMMQEHNQLLMDENEATREQRRAMIQAQAAILEADVFDEEAAWDVLVEKAELGLARQMIRMRLQHQILHEVLTEEQRLQLQNMWQNQAALAGSGGAEPGEGLGDCPYM